MKNVLYIGPYRQNDKYGEISRGYIDAIALQNAVTTYPIYYHKDIVQDSTYSRYEQKIENSQYDYIIQHCLPGDFFLNKQYAKNIGILNIETQDWHSNYSSINNINSMDEIWLSTNWEKKTLEKSGVTTPIKIVHPSIDTNVISDQSVLVLPNAYSNTYKFYTIIDDVQISNLDDLIIAFNLAFNFTDNVSLIIKSPITNLENHIAELKKKMGFKNKFKKELVLHQKINYTNLHNAGDCFISIDNANSFNPRVIEALILGKNPVINTNTSNAQFINNDNGYLIESHKTPVMLNNRPFSDDYDFYYANQSWYKIDTYHLVDTMRQIFQTWKKNPIKLTEKSNIGKKQIGLYTSIYVSNQICL